MRRALTCLPARVSMSTRDGVPEGADRSPLSRRAGAPAAGHADGRTRAIHRRRGRSGGAAGSRGARPPLRSAAPRDAPWQRALEPRAGGRGLGVLRRRASPPPRGERVSHRQRTGREPVECGASPVPASSPACGNHEPPGPTRPTNPPRPARRSPCRSSSRTQPSRAQTGLQIPFDGTQQPRADVLARVDRHGSDALSAAYPHVRSSLALLFAPQSPEPSK